MFCIYCGTQLPEGANFCYNCGKKQEIAPTPPAQQEVFKYPNLVKFEYERVEMYEVSNPENRGPEKRAFLIAQKNGKLGAFDECFEHQFVPCEYDSISICTHGYHAVFKVSKNKDYYLYVDDKLILDEGVDDIFVDNADAEPCAIEFKCGNCFGFRLRKRVPNDSIGLSTYTYTIYPALYDSVSINNREKVVLVGKGNSFGMISTWGNVIPCIFDSITIERRPAQFDPSANLIYVKNGYERRWLILMYNGKKYEYPEMLVREPKSIKNLFDIKDFNVSLLME